LPEKQLVSLRIYNTLGELVKELVNEVRETGSYSEIFVASNLPSGVYIYRLVAGNYVSVKTMVLIK
ncbi:MAG: T9SS type A sorting domain-containing protein, partial [Ignavibacteriaceae bacterium]